MHLWIYLSTFDVSLDDLHISLELDSAALIGVVQQGRFYSHIVYTRLMVRISSDHWVCLFLQGELPKLRTFGKILRNPLRSEEFLFLVFFVRHFSEEAPKLSAKYISCQFMRDLLNFFLMLDLIGGLLTWVLVTHLVKINKPNVQMKAAP